MIKFSSMLTNDRSYSISGTDYKSSKELSATPHNQSLAYSGNYQPDQSLPTHNNKQPDAQPQDAYSAHFLQQHQQQHQPHVYSPYDRYDNGDDLQAKTQCCADPSEPYNGTNQHSSAYLNAQYHHSHSTGSGYYHNNVPSSRLDSYHSRQTMDAPHNHITPNECGDYVNPIPDKNLQSGSEHYGDSNTLAPSGCCDVASYYGRANNNHLYSSSDINNNTYPDNCAPLTTQHPSQQHQRWLTAPDQQQPTTIGSHGEQLHPLAPSSMAQFSPTNEPSRPIDLNIATNFVGKQEQISNDVPSSVATSIPQTFSNSTASSSSLSFVCSTETCKLPIEAPDNNGLMEPIGGGALASKFHMYHQSGLRELAPVGQEGSAAQVVANAHYNCANIVINHQQTPNFSTSFDGGGNDLNANNTTTSLNGAEAGRASDRGNYHRYYDGVGAELSANFVALSSAGVYLGREQESVSLERIY